MAKVIERATVVALSAFGCNVIEMVTYRNKAFEELLPSPGLRKPI